MADLEFLKGNIKTIILNALFNGDKYGYEIAREIKEKTANQYEIKQTTLYAYLKRLEDQELISSYWGGGDSNGGRRRYYRLTEGGKQICIDYMSEWNFQRNVIDSLISDTPKEQNTEQPTPVPQSETTFAVEPKNKRTKTREKISPEQLSEINKRLLDIENGTAVASDSEKQTKTTINEQLRQIPPAKPQQIFGPIDTLAAKGNIRNSTHQNTTNEEVNKNNTASQSKYDTEYSTPHKRTATLTEESPQEKQYKQILENLMGNQLGKTHQESQTKEDFDRALNKSDIAKAIDTNSPLFETVKKLNQDGIQVKLYEPANNYKPVPMIFVNKLNGLAAWSVAISLILQIVLFYVLVSNNYEVKFTVFAILIAISLLPSIWFSIVYIKNPTKKTKCKFNFMFNFINAWIFVGVAIIIVSIIYFVIINSGNTLQLLMDFVLPIMLCLNAPLGVWYYKLLNKHLAK